MRRHLVSLLTLGLVCFTGLSAHALEFFFKGFRRWSISTVAIEFIAGKIVESFEPKLTALGNLTFEGVTQ